MKRLNLSPAKYWEFASRANSLGLESDRSVGDGFLCEIDGYEIYLVDVETFLAGDEPIQNADWETAEALLIARGV